VRERPCGSGLAVFAAAAVRFVTAHVAAGAELAGGRRDLERDGGLGTCSRGSRQLACSSRACVSIALVMAIGALRLVLVDRCARSGVLIPCMHQVPETGTAAGRVGRGGQ
jgi:hypothetical protein